MTMNRSQRRAAAKPKKQVVSPVKLMNSLANLDGVASLPGKIDEFVAASARMEAIAAQLDSVEDLEEAISTMRQLAETVEEQFPLILEAQERQSEVLKTLIEWLYSGASAPLLRSLLLKLEGKESDDSTTLVTQPTNEEAHGEA